VEIEVIHSSVTTALDERGFSVTRLLYSLKEPSVPIEKEVGLLPGPFWMLSKKS
jgi:hypothetical protein